MSLPPLATVEDLDARGIDTSNSALISALLESASAAVRDAAGVPISEVTATIELPSTPGRRLDLPAPVRSVDGVLVDGTPVEDWRLVGRSLWRDSGWQPYRAIPSSVSVTLTFGLPEVPPDIVDLVCNLVGAGVAHAASGYAARGSVVSERERVDDYERSLTFAQGTEATASPMELPPRTVAMLRRRFGSSVRVVMVRD